MVYAIKVYVIHRSMLSHVITVRPATIATKHKHDDRPQQPHRYESEDPDDVLILLGSFEVPLETVAGVLDLAVLVAAVVHD